MGATNWVSVGISGAALVVSSLAFLVSLAAHRSAGPRVSINAPRIAIVEEECWLQFKVTNAGRSSIDLDNASAGWLGETLSDLPCRLAGGSSKSLSFKARPGPTQYIGDSVTAVVALGTGERLTKRIKINEAELGTLQMKISLRQGNKTDVANAKQHLPDIQIDEV